jgi:hypothetical protein
MGIRAAITAGLKFRAAADDARCCRTRSTGQTKRGNIEPCHQRHLWRLWGNPIAVYTRTRPESYVLVSFGSDGRPDTTSTAEYFTTAERDIERQTARDIVFRDGKVITFAGK